MVETRLCVRGTDSMNDPISISPVQQEMAKTITPNRFLAHGLVLLVVFVAVFWIFLERQVRFAIEFQADWGHTLVIPFIAGWFVWVSRHRILAEPLKPSLTGLLLVVLGLAWFSLVSLGPVWARHHNFQGAGVGVVIFGLVLAFCGWRAMRWLWFPVAYLVIFSQTISQGLLEVLTFRLQGIATHGAEFGLAIIGFDVSRDGHTIHIFDNGRDVPVNVAEACSGMRMLVAFLALGVAMAWSGLETVWQRVLLVIAAIPTAIIINIFRVMTLGILATYDSGFVAGDFHSMVGMLWLVPAFFIYLGVMWILKHIVVDEVDDEAQDAEDEQPVVIRYTGRVSGIFISSIVLLVIGGAAFQAVASWLNVHLRSEAIALRQPLSLTPSTLGSWHMAQDLQLDTATTEQLGTNSYISRIYVNRARPDMPALQFHVAYYTGQVDSVPHVPDRCIEAGGMVQESPAPENLPFDMIAAEWATDDAHEIDGQAVPYLSMEDPLTGEFDRVHLPVGEQLYRHIEFSDPKNSGARIHAGYFFIANGRWCASPSAVKMTAFTGGDKHAYYCKVQIVATGGEAFDKQAFIDYSVAFLEPMLPQIMRLLPDWPDVQRQQVISTESPTL